MMTSWSDPDGDQVKLWFCRKPSDCWGRDSRTGTFRLVKAKIEAVSQARTEEVLRSLDSLAIWVLAHGLCSHFKNQIITNEERVLMRGLITLQYLRNERVHGLPANDGFDETVAQSGWKTLLDALHWMKAVHLRQVPTYKTL